MAENVIDTLKLDIIVNTKQNGQSITTLRNSLEKLYKFLNGVKDQDFSKVSNDVSNLAKSLEPLVRVLFDLGNSGANKNLTSLGTRLQTLNKRMGEIDAKAMATKFNQMAQAVTPFIDKVMSAQEALVALNNVMGGAKTLTKTATPKATTTTTPKATTNTNILGGKLGKSLNFGSMVAKLYFVRNITKQLGQDLAKVVQYGIDYEETLNLWQVAMKGNTAEARKFITEMNKAYGVSEATLMNYQAIFKNMLSSLGDISSEVSYDISELITQMALDYSSLYNVGIEESMVKFQAALAGQVRPIRNESGYDVTQATLGEVYESIGGTKTVRQLSETEKRLLRILAVYRQMKDTAVGDLENTITSTANQLRIMSDTVKDIATFVGVGLNQWLQQSKILIKLNAYLLALRELAISFAKSMGYVEPTGEDNKSEGQKQTDNLLEGAEGTADAYEEANKQVDELQGKLLGFDKFQVLSSAGVDDTNGDIDKILEELQKAKDEYQGILDQSQNIALFGDAERNIKGAYDILKDWGFTYNELSGQWEKDGKSIKDWVEEIKKPLAGLLIIIGLIANKWLIVASVLEYAYLNNEEFRNSVNDMYSKISQKVTPILNRLVDIFVSLTPIVETIVIFLLNVVDLLLPIVDEILKNIYDGTDDLSGIVEDIAFFATEFVQSLIPAISVIADIFEVIEPILWILREIGNVTTTVILLIGNVVNILSTRIVFVFEVITKIVSLFKSFISAIKSGDWDSLFDSLKTELTTWNTGEHLKENVLGIGDIVVRYFERFIPKYENGGLADKGSLFYAGEAGPELVTQTSGGGSTIMNMKQLEDAVARGFIRGYAATDNGYDDSDTTEVYVDGQRLFNIMRNTAKRNGYDFVRV